MSAAKLRKSVASCGVAHEWQTVMKIVAFDAGVVRGIAIAPTVRRLLLAEAKRREFVAFQGRQRILAGGDEKAFVERDRKHGEALDVLGKILEIVVG